MERTVEISQQASSTAEVQGMEDRIICQKLSQTCLLGVGGYTNPLFHLVILLGRKYTIFLILATRFHFIASLGHSKIIHIPLMYPGMDLRFKTEATVVLFGIEMSTGHTNYDTHTSAPMTAHSPAIISLFNLLKRGLGHGMIKPVVEITLSYQLLIV